jgi:transcription elongation GreA/GreB family factor
MASQVQTEDPLEDLKREVEHRVDEELDETTELSTLTERQQDRKDLQEIARRTVDAEEQIMRLNVVDVSTTESNGNYAVTVEKAGVDDTFTIFMDKPVDGWSREYDIVKVLDWYGIYDKNPHDLVFHDLYVQKQEDADTAHGHGWVPVEPPSYTPKRRERVRRKYKRMKSLRPSGKNQHMYLFLLAGVLFGDVALSVIPSTGLFVSLFVGIGMFIVFTLLGVAVVDNE